MKKIEIVIFSIFMVLFTGCQNHEEQIMYECSLWGNLEFYDTTYVTEIYSRDAKNISKLHITTSYSTKWDDVDVKQLMTQLNQEKEEIYKSYEEVSYEIHQIGNNITAEQIISMTTNNLNMLKQDQNYQNLINHNQLNMEQYVNWLTSQGYQCQNKNS